MQLTIRAVGAKRQLRALVTSLIVVGVVWELSISIVGSSDNTIFMFGLGLIVLALTLIILDDWRTGVLVFLTWILFEDLARKYLRNTMVVYFIKDFMVGLVYLSFWFARRRRQVEIIKIPFLLPLSIFFCLAVIQVFNTWSPSIVFGLLGLKLYFYYVPLIFLGYAMLEKPSDLDRLLRLMIGAGIIVAVLGIAQAVLGISFLTPEDIAPELYTLTHLNRMSPVTHETAVATSSVFASNGRFSYYLIVLAILTMGAEGYLILSRRRGALFGLVGIGVVAAAIMVTGTRTPFVFGLLSALTMSSAFLWGAPRRWGQGRRLLKALRRGFFVGACGLFLLAVIFPAVFDTHWAFLSETLSPKSSGSELEHRGYSFPVRNLQLAFEHERWVYGYGTGINSLGTQYVGRYLDAPAPDVGVESGYGALIVEMGILGPILWLIWVTALLLSGWKVVNQLRETIYFPIGFAIWWYSLVTLVMLMYFNSSSYQNYVNNAYLWLLLGVFYRLPKLAKMPQAVPISQQLRSVPRWRLGVVGR
jgi:hypothetical protein